jgi:pimeloyl-ACP methyl ester carboxylesterase
MRQAAGYPASDSGPAADTPVSRLTEDTEITGRYIEVAGFRTFYESAGSGYPVVCIHTGGADSRQYRHLLGHLAGLGYHAIALDMPGHGKSYPDLATLEPITSAAGWVNFVLAFARRLGLMQPAYVGCAMSGSLLLRLAAEHPEATAGIVSANGNAEFFLSREFLDVLDHPQVSVADYLDSMTVGLLGPDLPPHALNEARWHNARNLTPEVMQADMRIYAAHDVRQQLAEIKAPVLHLRGEFDRTVTDESAAAIRGGIRRVIMRQLPRVGHLAMLESPAMFNDAVAEFLQEVLGP